MATSCIKNNLISTLGITYVRTRVQIMHIIYISYRGL